MLPKYAPGEKIPGTPYVVAYTIGRGGGGHVVAVRDEHLDVMRAVKLLEVDPRPGEKLEDAKKAVLNEAVVIAKLHKLCREHIVEVLFVGQTADQYAVPYIVMELIDGAPLRDLLKRRGGKLEPVHARQVGIDVLAALAAAHDHGIVHRDLKPANIMCEVLDQNRVRMKVIDFGIVGGVNQRTKRIAGTFRYAAPEQIHIQGPSPLMAQTDIYSLGCILYECLAGQGPFDSFCKTNEHFVHAHLTAEPPPISQLVPGIPRAFDVFFASMLAKDPNRRPPSARACAAQLIDLPWLKRQDADFAKTQEMLQAAVHSVVRDHEEKRAPALGSTFGPTQKDPPRTLGATLQSSGVERPPPATMLSPSAAPPPGASHPPGPRQGGSQQSGAPQAGYQQAGYHQAGVQQGGFQQSSAKWDGYQRVGTPAGFQAAPVPPGAPPQGGTGGTMRVSQLPYAPTDGGPEPTRTSAPTPPPVNANGTDPLSNNGRRDNLSAPYPGYWQQQPQQLESDNNRDPSTFGAVAQTHRISPQARWVAIAAGLFSAAVLLVAFGVWLARRT
ncbi:MAG: protein kinase, partial [Polyangiaceae bacterium]